MEVGFPELVLLIFDRLLDAYYDNDDTI